MTSATSAGATDAIGPEGLRAALLAGTAHLERNQRLLDDLNVFPVPDGDTGANMVATLRAGVRALGDGPVALPEAAARLCDGLLRASRGNSGFITAWFFSGLLGAAERRERIDGDTLAEGFAHGAFQARTSLLQPVEGTMITVIAAMAAAMAERPGLPPAACLERAIEAGRVALLETPRLLPILAKAGVVDAGALGFVLLVEGMLSGLTGEDPPVEREEAYRFRPDPRALLEWTPAPERRYCTEVLVEDPRDPRDPTLRPFLEALGDSIALVADERFLKLHIHTDDPEAVLKRLAGCGTVASSKVEDMREQVGATTARLVAEAAGQAAADGACAVLACIPGGGFEEVFCDLGAARCLVYGRTLPTPGAILDALTEIEAHSVILLPNNGNIVPAATLARDLSGRDVVVVPTRNVVEGIAAAYGFSENEPIAENARNMRDCMGLARCLCLYRSVADSTWGDLAIPEGSCFVTHGDDVLAVRGDPAGAALAALEAAGIAQCSDLTLFLGEGFDDAILPAIEAGVAALNPRIEVASRRGGQPRELLVMALE